MSIANAFLTLMQPEVFLAMMVGILGGMIIGILPGLGGTIAAALMMPLTYSLSPTAALVMLTTIYTSAVYGGSFTAILLHTPGTTASAATALDGYELTKQGKGLEALGVASFASVVGGLFSAIMLLMIAPSLSKVALMFSSPEYFLIAIFGLTIIGSLVKDAPIKGLAAGAFGLLISTVGMDAMTGQLRFTFGKAWLHSGITIVPTMIGLFAISQVLILAESWAHANEKMFEDTEGNLKESWWTSVKRMVPSGKTMLKLLPNAIRSSIIGLLVGIMPGAGGDVACWVSYDAAKRSSKEPDSFGKGNIAGVCASEAANNAVTGGSFIPLFTLGVPGSSTAAVILGGMMIHGLIPGNSLFTDQADKVYPIMIGFMVANVLMGIIGVLIGPTLTRLAGVPISSLAPILIVLCLVGAYTTNGNIYDVYIALAFGIVGYLMRRTGFTPTPIVLAVILGGMAENGFSQSLIMARGDVLGYYLSRPISCVLSALTLFALLWPVYQWIKGKVKARKA